MKNHFIISYPGNKRCECEIIYENIKDNLTNVKTIIEPFCGTSAFSFFISLKHPKQFEYVLNDNDSYLIELYKLIQDETKLNDFINELKNDFELYNNKIGYNNYIKNNTLKGYFIARKFYCIRSGLFPTTKPLQIETIEKIKTYPIINFLRTEKIILSSENGNEIIKKYNNSNCLLFIDPPYLNSHNDNYKNPSVEIFEFLNNELKNLKSKILICIEDMWMTKLIFKDYKSITYKKKYQPSKKDTNHILYNNFIQ